MIYVLSLTQYRTTSAEVWWPFKIKWNWSRGISNHRLISLMGTIIELLNPLHPQLHQYRTPSHPFQFSWVKRAHHHLHTITTTQQMEMPIIRLRASSRITCKHRGMYFNPKWHSNTRRIFQRHPIRSQTVQCGRQIILMERARHRRVAYITQICRRFSLNSQSIQFKILTYPTTTVSPIRVILAVYSI